MQGTMRTRHSATACVGPQDLRNRWFNTGVYALNMQNYYKNCSWGAARFTPYTNTIVPQVIKVCA